MSLGQPLKLEQHVISALISVLENANPESTTNRDVQLQIAELVRGSEENARLNFIHSYCSDPNVLFLGNEDLTVVYRSLEEIEQSSIREAVSFLENVIRRRESQDDLWPDGRLELGLAHAALGDYVRASRVLIEVIEICESGGKYYGQNMAMAA